METILIIAAVLVITVAVVLTANSLMGGPQESSSVIDDKFAASMRGAELLGYDKPFDPNDPTTAPDTVRVNRGSEFNVEVVDWDKLPKGAQYLASITGTDGKVYPIYGSGGSGGGSGTAYIPTTPVDADDDNDGILNGDEAAGCVSDPDPECGVPAALANLAVDGVALRSADDPSITFAGEVPEGGNILVSASILNLGNADAESFKVSFYYAQAMSIPTPPHSSSAMAIRAITGLAALPGPTIGPVCSSEYAPVCGINGNTYTNLCYASSAGVEVGYAGECNPSLIFLGLATVPGIAYGSSAVATASISGMPSGDYTIYTIVDPANEVMESNENDNAGSTEISSVSVPTDLYVNSNDVTRPRAASVGDFLSFTATVHNSGAAASGVVVSFFEKNYTAMGINPPFTGSTALLTLPITGYVALPGPTIPPCEVTGEPVCGADDVSYANECFADRAGVEVVYNGECISGWHYIGSDSVDVGTASSAEATASWTPALAGDYQVVVWIDPFAVLDEASTGNNYVESLPFTVSETPIAPITPIVTPTPTATINPPHDNTEL